jgi:hypothetical protein
MRSRYLTQLLVVENESQIPLVSQSYVSQIIPSFWDGGAIRDAEGAWTPDVDIIAQARREGEPYCRRILSAAIFPHRASASMNAVLQMSPSRAS